MIMSFPGKPFYCLYWTTFKCNSKCEYCNIWKQPAQKNSSYVRFLDAEKNIDDLKKIGVKLIDFSGGEPLLNKDLPEILKYAKQAGFFVKLSTNGLLYPDKAEELKGLTSRIYFSFDTISAEEYKKIRGIDGFERVVESIQIAKDLKQEFCLMYTVTDETINNISGIVDFCKRNRAPIFIHPCFSYFDNKALSVKYIKKIKKYFWSPYVRMSLPQLNFHYTGGNNISHPTCKAGRSTLEISPDNCLISPCFQHPLKKIKINGQLFSIYNSTDWKVLFNSVGKYDFCEHCTSDCHFGQSYWDRLGKYFINQNLSYLKNIVEAIKT